MNIITEDFNTRIANGGRVYLSEVYKRLGFEKPIHLNHHEPFWDKDGYHEDECYALVSYTETDSLNIDEDRLEDL